MSDQKTEQKTDEQRHLEAQAMQRLQMERLRDEFAMAAMQAMLSAYPCQALGNDDGGIQADHECIAGDAYNMADAMLAARTQEPRHD